MVYRASETDVLEWSELTLEKLMVKFSKGSEMVLITKNRELLGGINNNDMIYYLLYDMAENIPEQLINRSIRFLTYVNEQQVYQDAALIFSERDCINDIPVVDARKKFLFQLSRDSKKKKNREILKGMHEIAVSFSNGTMKSFIKEISPSKLILTGADCGTLKRVKRLIVSFLQNDAAAKDISVILMDDILDCHKLDHSTVVISMNKAVLLYLKKTQTCKANIFSCMDILHWNDLTEIDSPGDKVDEKLISTFKHVFGYHKIIFSTDHPIVNLWEKALTSGGLSVYNQKNQTLPAALNINHLSPFEILLISGKNDEYYYQSTVSEFVSIFEWLHKYREIAQCDLTHEVYLQKCLNYLKSFQAKGFSGWLHSVNSYWEQKLKDHIRYIDGFNMIDDLDEVISGNKYIVDQNINLKRTTEDNYISNDWFMACICENTLVEILEKKCRGNVWALYYSFAEQLPYMFMPQRTRLGYLKHKEDFPNHFVENMFGDENYPIMKLLEDMIEGTQIVKINDGYLKYTSNYRSTYFNTDLFGHRIVTDRPSHAPRKIWLMGSCVFSGYVEEDTYTVASCLQRNINKEFFGQYEVIDVSCDYGSIRFTYNKMLEKKVGSEDIIIILCDYFHTGNKTIEMNLKKINDSFDGKAYSWDTPRHSSRSVLQITADTIFHNIKEAMKENKYQYRFKLEENVEYEIGQFLKRCQEQLQQSDKYQQIFAEKTINKQGSKNGAIIMNCNPFTYGHQYLIETASRLVDCLYVFVVEEDKSTFAFADRYRMVQEATKEFSNVFVLPSGQFMISTVTFPGYFMKENPNSECFDTFLDLKIFTHYIAPALKINMRFVGEEPFDKVTAQYNHDMKIILSESDIDVIEIPRLKRENIAISATKVRKLLKLGEYSKLKQYVPKSTLKILGIRE